MTARASVRAELEKLRQDIEAIRGGNSENEQAPAEAEEHKGLAAQLKQLQQMVQDTLDGADETVADHPRAAIAGALALGIVIGRLTVR
jgi:ElaB/YqjD/DUF883 family membrane-anchored ribosome-binding protein